MMNDRAKSIVFLIAVVAISLWFLYIVRGLLMPVFYGIVFAIVLYPMYVRNLSFLKNREIPASILTILAGLLISVFVVFVVGGYLIRDAGTLLETVAGRSDDLASYTENWGERVTAIFPEVVRDRLTEINFREQIVNITQNIAQGIIHGVQDWTRNIIKFIALTVLVFYSTFFLLINGKRWVARLKSILPLPENDEDYLIDRFANMVRAALRIVFVMGAIQGFLGGLIFWLVGIPAPFFWGLVFAVFSLIPGIGHPFLWLPAAVIFFIIGSPVKALVLILFGAIIMGMSDDVLRPYLVGRRVKIHPFLILISTLGGLITFGFAGLILGPVVASLMIAMWQLYEKRYSEG